MRDTPAIAGIALEQSRVDGPAVAAMLVNKGNRSGNAEMLVNKANRSDDSGDTR
ncbi:hypothetical protein [Paenibacillus thalictri]|uniref:hypothetical protein n=1 Tax=Paenibacillus thalictri TaxID=2527873 RepID=UPI0013EEFDBB|nr:hypothetical protein [Paenibacillus thalictri]